MSIRRGLHDRAIPIHPGELLREDFMKPLGLTQAALANDLHVPISQISAIVREKRGLNADMALRLGQYFCMTPDFWMNLQSHYELESAKDIAGKRIKREVHPGQHRNSKTQQESA